MLVATLVWIRRAAGVETQPESIREKMPLGNGV